MKGAGGQGSYIAVDDVIFSVHSCHAKGEGSGRTALFEDDVVICV